MSLQILHDGAETCKEHAALLDWIVKVKNSMGICGLEFNKGFLLNVHLSSHITIVVSRES